MQLFQGLPALQEYVEHSYNLLFARRKVVELQVTEWGRAGNQDTRFLFMELPELCA